MNVRSLCTIVFSNYKAKLFETPSRDLPHSCLTHTSVDRRLPGYEEDMFGAVFERGI